MSPEELVKFLNVLRYYVPPYWRDRIDHVIQRIGGQVKSNPQQQQQ